MLQSDGVTPVATCDAKKKRGPGLCSKRAGWRTDHPGVGRCYLHGGATPIKSGRYSRLIRPRVGDLIKQFEADPDPLNVIPDLILARAMLADFIERFDAWREAFLAWHASWSQFRPIPEDLALSFLNVIDEYEILTREDGELTEGQQADLAAARGLVRFLKGEGVVVKPREVLDVSAAIQHINVISQIIKREQDARAENAISRKEYYRLQEAMAAAVLKRVTDPEILKGIRSDWLDVRLGVAER